MNEHLYNPETERLDEINERLSLISLKKGLTFGTDSYILAAFTSRAKTDCVELGGGTGVVSLLLASRERFGKIYCAEIQEYFAGLIGRNAKMNGLDDRIVPLCMDIRNITANDTGGEAGAVVTNPPYMPENSGFSNASPELTAARREENGTIKDFTDAAARVLRFGGMFYCVYRPERLADLFCAMRESGIEPKRLVMIYPTAAEPPCLVLVSGKRGAAPSVTVSRPLIIYEDKKNGVYTPDMQMIYDTFSCEHLFRKQER